MRPRLCASVASSIVATVLGAGPAFAAELLWDAPEQCPRDAFVQELTSITGEGLADSPVAFLEVRVQRYAPATWTAVFALRTAPGDASPTRRIEGKSCQDVSSATAVAVALALHRGLESTDNDPGNSRSATAPASTSDGELDARSVPTGSASKPVERSGAQGPPLRLGALVSVVVDSALLGQTTLGVQVGALAGLGRFEFGMHAAVLAPTELRVTESLGVKLQGYLADIDGCLVVADGRLRPRVCLAYQLGLLRGEGTGSGLEVSRPQTAVWHALHPSISVSLPVTDDVRLRVFAGAAIGLTRAQFVFDEGRRAHELPAVSGQGGLSMVWSQ